MKRIFNLTTLSFSFYKLKLVHMGIDFLIQKKYCLIKYFFMVKFSWY